MSNIPAIPVVSVQFGDVDTFCDEPVSRGPNVEPIVRICRQVRSGQSDTHGSLPIEHVFGHVSVLRQTGELLRVIAPHLYLGRRWSSPDDMPDRAEVRARVDQLYERSRDVRHWHDPSSWWTGACTRSPCGIGEPATCLEAATRGREAGADAHHRSYRPSGTPAPLQSEGSAMGNWMTVVAGDGQVVGRPAGQAGPVAASCAA